jgi:cytochrome c-type biogenesis protein CcmH/NrfF
VSVLKSATFRRWSWLAIAALVLVALVRAGTSDAGPVSEGERVHDIAITLKCPTCRSQSVAGSDSPAAKAIRAEISRRIEDGQSADEIRAAIAASYDDVQLIPGRSGLEGLVWILPVVVLVLALAGLSAAFARWRRASTVHASDADRELVERALAEHEHR